MKSGSVAVKRHSRFMGHIDSCLGTLRHLITAGSNGIRLAITAIEEYWAATPTRARKTGLLYIQQILHDQLNEAGSNSREFAASVDAYIEKKLAT
jgi:hypothetical protein